MPRIGPLLAQLTVLQRDQIHKQRWMLVDQVEKAGAVQPNQSERCQRLCIPAVALIGRHQILVKKQLPCALTDATPSTTGQLHQSLIHDVNGIDRVSLSEHQDPRWQGLPATFTMLADQRQ